MTLGQLYVHRFTTATGTSRYTLAVACADGCGSIHDTRTTSVREARDRLRDAGWIDVRGRGWVCGECAAKQREAWLMGILAEVVNCV